MKASDRLAARPPAFVHSGPAGLFPLHISDQRDGLLYVPETIPNRLIVLLHGAGGAAERIVKNYRDRADEFGFILLAPDSRGTTWDRVRGDFGPDIDFIDRALEQVFAKYAIDPKHLAIGGFSDGASYALSAGITNGDLFSHILAFSPGFSAPSQQHGRPRIFVSHGTEDEILPIDRTSRRFVPVLRDNGYRVEYVEFRGGHTVPREIAARGFKWFTK